MKLERVRLKMQDRN